MWNLKYNLLHKRPVRTSFFSCHDLAAVSPYLFLRKSGEPQHWSSPLAMMAIRSPSRSASSMKCVVSRMVRPRFSPCSRSQVARRAEGSIPEVGSSSITTYREINKSTWTVLALVWLTIIGSNLHFHFFFKIYFLYFCLFYDRHERKRFQFLYLAYTASIAMLTSINKPEPTWKLINRKQMKHNKISAKHKMHCEIQSVAWPLSLQSKQCRWKASSSSHQRGFWIVHDACPPNSGSEGCGPPH